MLLMGLSGNALAFDWPFSNEEFQKKLSSKDLTPSTRYFARGPSYFKGQIWNQNDFVALLKKQNYRIRQADEPLLPGDAKQLNYPDCKNLTKSEEITEIHMCWMWKTHDGEVYMLVGNPMEIESTWAGDPVVPHWKAALDPILIAQYKGQQPIMQNELKISDFPVNCMNATMAIEDNEFLEHSGISYMGLSRSLVKNIIKRRYAQGGSTITQQLVKNYFLTPEKSIKRKLHEIYLAVKLETEWSKDQILETYLNIIYMGQTGAFQVIGFGAAAEYYFDKPAKQLELHECALLAAIINNAVTNNPWKNPDKSLARRNLVLSKMQELKLITENEYATAVKAPLPKAHELKASESSPYFFEAVRQQLSELHLEGVAANIYTSLDIDAQQLAQNALQKQITELEKSRKNLIKNKAKGLKLEGLVLATENQTGLVNILVGGQSYRTTQFNRALNGRRQIGSLVKPVVYLTALNNGDNPLTEVIDQKFIWKYDKKTWSPENYDHKYNGAMPLYHALKESLNAPTAQVAQKLGIDKVINTARLVGFTSQMEPTPATSLGASVHYPLEVLDAYRTFANLGRFSHSGFIERIKDRDGEVIFNYEPVFEQKTDIDQTSVLVGMMKETLRSGTAKTAAAYGWKKIAAGKTGTTSDNKDAWFAGFTPHQTAIIWLGYDQGVSSQLTGGSGAVPVWVDLMKQITVNWSDDDFKFPDTVEKREVDLHGTNVKTELLFKRSGLFF